ncbi:MAG: hypothetical protein FJ109_05185 [Deltaproteobacteria bacterium]|nr:hypothetical protein [Deltaproteobacteria bacterium]
MKARQGISAAKRAVSRTDLCGIVLAGLVAAVAGFSAVAAGAGDETVAGPFREAPLSQKFKAARKEMEKGNFRQALEGFLAIRSEAGERCEGAVAVMDAARCHVALYEFDQAVDLLSGFIASGPGTTWEAVALATRGELYMKFPDQCYRTGERCRFNTDVREGQAEYAWYLKAALARKDRIEARSKFKLALEAGTRAASSPAAGGACLASGDLRAEAIANNRGLAELVAQAGYQAWDDATDPQEITTVDLSVPFEKVERQRTQVLYLLDECDVLGKGLKDLHPLAEARLQKAMFLAQFPENPPKAFVEAQNKAWEEWSKAHPDGQPPFRYETWQRPEHLDPTRIAASLLKDFPKAPEIDKYEALYGRFLSADQQFKAAAEQFRAFLKKRPDSKWVGDVRSSLDEIVNPSLSFYLPSVAYPGRAAQMSVTGRNVKSATMEFRRIDPKLVLEAQWFVKTGSMDLQQQVNGNDGQKFLSDLFGAGDKAEVVEVALDDPGDHSFVTKSAEVNLSRNGLYVYRSKLPVGEQYGLFLRTGIIVVTRSLAGRTSYYAADAVTGKPVPDSKLTMREVYHRQGILFGFQEVRIHSLTTDGAGMADFRFTEGKGISGNQASAWLVSGDSLAISEYDYPSYAYDAGSETGVDKGFLFADRPVYRPGDRVYFKAVVREQSKGGYRNVAGRPYRVMVSTPQGTTLFDQRFKADMFGTVDGSLSLPEGAPLGYYYISVSGGAQDDRYVYLSAGANFRVEEYKKPEFKVTVTPSADLAGVGDKVSARVEARYYFGGAVAGAKVTYSIERSPYTHTWSPPDPWKWLYGEGWDGVYPDYYYGGTPIASGEGVTDATGRLTVELPPLSEEELKLENDWRYTVRATVMDLSRRSIEGSGTVVVSRSPFFVHIEQPSGFYLSGDSPEVRVHTMTLAGVGVPGKARWKLERLEHIYGEKEPKRHPAGEGTADVDERGEADVRLTLPQQGHFEMVVTCTDAAGREAKGVTGLFVADAKTSKADVRYAGVTLWPDRRSYEPGDKMKALVVVEKPGWVLVTAEAGGQVLFEQLLEMDTTGRVVEFPIEAKHAPNFFLSAGQVRDHDWYFGQRQIAVPPAGKLLTVEVLPDGNEHRPGDKGKIKVKVTGPDGKPVQADVALWMFDSSVLYIQGETMGNIAQYFHGQLRYQGMYAKQSGYVYLPYRAFIPLPDLPYKINGLPYVPGYYGGGYGPGYYGFDESGRGAGWAMGGGGSMPMGRVTSRAYEFEEDLIDGSLAMGKKGDMLARAEAPAEAVAVPMATAVSQSAAGPGALVAVREYFPDSVLWVPHLKTGKDGLGEAEVTYPDSLTTWELRAVAADAGELVGQSGAQTVTTKKLVARLEAPRFLVAGDKARLAGVVRNDQAVRIKARLTLALEGKGLELKSDDKATLELGPGEEKRVDFEVLALTAGEVNVTLAVDAGKEKDALRKKFPILAWGARRLEGQSLTAAPNAAGTVSFELPAADLRSGEELTVAVDGSLAGVLFSALPYLLDYPYGCVEQTLSRFLPAVQVGRALDIAGLKLDGIPALPAEASLADPMSKHGPWYHNGVFSGAGLDTMLKDGLLRLVTMQGGDGGWGWWAGFPSDPYMTAHVLDGLLDAFSLGLAVDENVIARGLVFLQDRLDRLEERNLHMDLFQIYVVSRKQEQSKERMDKLFEARNDLSDYGKALLALSLYQAGRLADATLVLDNLKDRAWVDEKSGTASFKDAGTNWWWWWQDRTETVAWVLKAFLQIRPSDPIVDKFARWLVVNREAGHWDSTRHTATVVRILAEYLGWRKEFETQGDVRVLINGKERAEWTIGKGQAALFHQSLTLQGEEVGNGPVTVTVEFSGEGRVHSSAFLGYFSAEEPIPAWSSRIAVDRTYYLLTRKPIEPQPDGGPAGQGGALGKGGYDGWGADYLGGFGTAMGGPDQDFDRKELKDGDPLSPGDLIEVVVRIDSPNDYEYLVFEDPKPAGTEPAELTSGSRYEHGSWWYREYRDQKVVSFLDRLAQGKQALSYRLIAQIPGTFRVLPHLAHAMYSPRVQAGSSSATIQINP